LSALDPTPWSTILWPQFGAAIDMLENTVMACPDELWDDAAQQPEFWYLVYHTLFFLDLYLSGSVAGFAPPDPFTLAELDFDGVRPDRPYTKAELRVYLDHGRTKCRSTLAALTDATASKRCGISWLDASVVELHLYNMRHVQHHAAQLNLILRQRTDSAPGWVARTRTDRVG
jgi:hypothetical protein